MRLLLAIAAAAGAYWYYNRNRRYTGSQTNASDAVDDVHLPAHPRPEQIVDEGIKETFPASDPVAVGSAGETAWERQQRGKRR
ncbi:MAG TPA: hypothetical protein VFV74_12120 [Burkholderiales bacterium]|nr:hypothetical protein [Burkholderiales bacterium]